MSQNIIWWLIEMTIWYAFFYIIFFTIKNPVNIGWVSLIIVLLGSFGIFASPLTRHLSFWNKIIDQIVKKEQDKMKY